MGDGERMVLQGEGGGWAALGSQVQETTLSVRHGVVLGSHSGDSVWPEWETKKKNKTINKIKRN